MAFSLSLRFPTPISVTSLPKPIPGGQTLFTNNSTRKISILRATENPETSNTTTDPKQETTPDEMTAEIKAAMAGSEKKDFLTGVVEEVGQIEWPPFNKVLGTTGVVLAVISGSSVVLLTVNAVLAELSDRVFAGRGVQDFFG